MAEGGAGGGEELGNLQRRARWAGALYLIGGACAAAGTMLPQALITGLDASRTGLALLANEHLYRFALGLEVVGAVSFIPLTLILAALFGRSRPLTSALMVLLYAVSAPVWFSGVAAETSALWILHEPLRLAAQGSDTRLGLTMTLLAYHQGALLLVQVFWGFWLLPLAYLLWRAADAPRLVAGLIALAGVAYPVATMISFGWPQLPGASAFLLAPAGLGELTAIAWLLAGAPSTLLFRKETLR